MLSISAKARSNSSSERTGVPSNGRSRWSSTQERQQFHEDLSPAGKRPILFVMCENTQAADEAGDYKAAAEAGVADATPYTLRHSFCSLLIAEGRSVIEVARQMGHGANLTLNTYGHVIDELADGDRIDAEVEIERARRALQPGSPEPKQALTTAPRNPDLQPERTPNRDEDVRFSYVFAEDPDDLDTFWA